ncbi:hypothetical protein Tco_0757946, partial [Tanacetum coccineum]
DTYQSISVMVQDTPIEETVFMAIEVDESDDDLEEEDNSCTSRKELGAIVEKYRIPLDLHPRLLASDFCMSQLPSDATGIAPSINLFRFFQILCKQGGCFSFSKRRGMNSICMDDSPLDDFPSDGYYPGDVFRLCERSAKLRDVAEVVFVRFGLSSIRLNRKCNPVFRRKDDNTGMVGVYVEYSIYSMISNHTSMYLVSRERKREVGKTLEKERAQREK